MSPRPPDGYFVRTEPDRRQATDDRRQDTELPSRAPSGYTRKDARNKPTTPATTPATARPARPARPPGQAPAKTRPAPRRTSPRRTHREARPLEVGATSLGKVTVLMARPMAIMIQGGDTMGQHWIPRSQILDGPLDRNAQEGDHDELWVPSWLADKIPW